MKCEAMVATLANVTPGEGALTMHMQESGRVRVEIDGDVVSECEHSDSAVTVCGPCTLDMAARIRELESERLALRRIMVACCEAIGNGSFCSENYSLEFLSGVPNEIRLAMTRPYVTPATPGTRTKGEKT